MQEPELTYESVLESTDEESALSAFATAGAALTDRQRVFLAARLGGKDDIEAARIAGFPNPWKAVASLRRTLDASVFNQAAFAAAGLDPIAAAKKLVSLTEAKTVKTASYEGKITDTIELEDNKTQLDALALYYNLSGLTPPKRSDITLDASVRQVQIPEDFKEMSEEELLKTMQLNQIAAVVRK